MFNPNNTKELASRLSERLGYIVLEETLEKLSEKQRNFLASLLHLDSMLEVTRDGKHPLKVITEIINYKPKTSNRSDRSDRGNRSDRSDKTNWYLNEKLNK